MNNYAFNNFKFFKSFCNNKKINTMEGFMGEYLLCNIETLNKMSKNKG